MANTYQIRLLVTITLLILVSCSDRPSKWLTTNWNEFHPAELNLSKISLNQHSTVVSKDELLTFYGIPDTIRYGGGFFPEAFKNNRSRKTLVEYQIYEYGQISFAVWNDRAQIQFIDFRNSDIVLDCESLHLSNRTTLREIKAKFPDTYEWRNYPLHHQFGADPKELFGFDKKDCVWLDFENGLDDYHWYIELTFLKGKLIWADFDIVEDKYRP